MAKYLDDNGLLYFWQKIKAAFVAKDGSKVLSTNDYTTAEKNKLAGIATGADVNVITSVKRNGTALSISNKAVDVTVPTKTSDLSNDSGFITSADIPEGAAASTTTPKMDGTTAAVGTELAFARGDHVHPKDTSKANLASPTFTGTPKAPTAAAGTNTTQIATTAFVTTAITNAIAGVTQISYSVVTSLPSTGSAGVIYLVAHSHGTSDIYDEYIWTGTAFEKLGHTDVDLSGYLQTTDMVAITNAEIDTVVGS